VIVQILVARRDAQYALTHQGANRVLHQFGPAVITETPGEPIDQPDRFIGACEQQRTAIGADRAAVERGHHAPAFDPRKFHLLWVTLCLHRESPVLSLNSFS
jgi:hypothetical protein